MINTYNIDLHGYSYGNCNFYGYDCFTGETLIHAMYDSTLNAPNFEPQDFP